jgi:sugar/nucleoside kinase (ribokinase family)
VIALLGNLSRDFLPGLPPRAGGAPYHAARALQHLAGRALLYARCAEEDRGELLPPVARLGTPVHYVPGTSTATFEMSYHEDGERAMTVRAVGDVWLPEDVPKLPDAVGWVHVAPLARSDFPAGTLAAAARGRRLSLDGQGLVRRPGTGPLELDDEFDPEVLQHVWVLKLSDEEAAVVGDPVRLGVRELVLTHGARGATVIAAGREEHVPAFAIDCDDPTGAGDGFCVAYVASRAAGLAPRSAARRATTVVASMLAEVA